MSEMQINPLVCERLRQLINSGKDGKKTKVKDLADAVHISPVHMSNIVNGRKRLTDDLAQLIANYFDVRKDWILGKDSYKTTAEFLETLAFVDGWKDDFTALKIVLEQTGYSIGLRQPIVKKLSITARQAWKNDTGEKAPETIEVTPDGVSISKNGQKLCELSEMEYQQLRDRIISFAKFSISEVIEKKGRNDVE